MHHIHIEARQPHRRPDGAGEQRAGRGAGGGRAGAERSAAARLCGLGLRLDDGEAAGVLIRSALRLWQLLGCSNKAHIAREGAWGLRRRAGSAPMARNSSRTFFAVLADVSM